MSNLFDNVIFSMHRSDVPPNPISGDMWIDSNTLDVHIYDGNRWLCINGTLMNLFSQAEKEHLLNSKDLFKDLLFVVVTEKYRFSNLNEIIENLGIEIIWMNGDNNIPANMYFPCLIVKTIDDANLIRVTYPDMVGEVLIFNDKIIDRLKRML